MMCGSRGEFARNAALFSCLLSGVLTHCGGGGDGDVDDGGREIETGEVDSETSTGQPDSEQDGGASDRCDGACGKREWTICTCQEEDPCQWSGDGLCDGYCVEFRIVDTMFDDSQDCGGNCSGLCERGVFSPCTCHNSDPCVWAEDGACDDFCLTSGVVDEMFNDDSDCGLTGNIGDNGS